MNVGFAPKGCHLDTIVPPFDLPCGNTTAHPNPGTQIPCTDQDAERPTLKLKAACTKSAGHSAALGYTIQCHIETTVATGPQGRPRKALELYSDTTSSTFNIDGVLHWAWNGNYFYFWPTQDRSVEAFNKLFPVGTSLLVRNRINVFYNNHATGGPKEGARLICISDGPPLYLACTDSQFTCKDRTQQPATGLSGRYIKISGVLKHPVNTANTCGSDRMIRFSSA